MGVLLIHKNYVFREVASNVRYMVLIKSSNDPNLQ